MQLTKRKALDATGAPLDPDAVYTPLLPFAAGHLVYNPGIAELRGSHAAVVATPGHWIRADASTDEKHRALVSYRAAKEAAQPTLTRAAGDPGAPRILGPIPAERRRVALRNYHDKAGHWYEAGKVYDLNDPFVKANEGDMFGPDEAA